MDNSCFSVNFLYNILTLKEQMPESSLTEQLTGIERNEQVQQNKTLNTSKYHLTQMEASLYLDIVSC